MDIRRMQDIQRELHEKYDGDLSQMTLPRGVLSLLWAVAEIGEVADVVKKNGEEAVVNDAEVRADFVCELADVYMYLADVMLCFHVTPEELTKEYEQKHAYNLHRWEDE